MRRATIYSNDEEQLKLEATKVDVDPKLLDDTFTPTEILKDETEEIIRQHKKVKDTP